MPQFFNHVGAVGIPSFLAAQDELVCLAAEKLGVSCIVSQHYRRDGALSKERWYIMLEILRRNHSIAYAGMDVRFLAPATSWNLFGEEVDTVFEGVMNPVLRKVKLFTPDFALAFPTSRAIRFLEVVTTAIRGRSLDGLPAFLHDPSLLRFNLMGPAEQDLLHDLLLSSLYNRTVVVRKYSLARDAAMGYADGTRLAGTLVNRSSMPHCSQAAMRRNPGWGERACLGAGVVDEHDLDPFPAVPGVVFSKRAYGTVLLTPKLRVLLTDNRGILVGYNPCAICSIRDPSRTIGVHCLGKLPSCLNLTRCPCLHRHKSNRPRNGGDRPTPKDAQTRSKSLSKKIKTL